MSQAATLCWHGLSCLHSLTYINCMFTSLMENSDGLSLLFFTLPGPIHPNSRLGWEIETFPDCLAVRRQFTPHDSEIPQTKYTNVYYHCKPEFVRLRNPYSHPERQIEDVLNTKPYWQHLELIQIEDTVKQIKPERKHLTLFEIDSVVVCIKYLMSSFFNFFSRAQHTLS